MPLQSASEILGRVAHRFHPPPNTPLDEFAEAEVFIPSDVSQVQPGRMRLWPTQRGIAKAMGDNEIERVSVLKAARVGYTQLLVAVIANYVKNQPCPIMLTFPTEDDAANYVRLALDPVLDASPGLRNIIPHDSRSRLTLRQFPGGSLRVVSANAPRNLRAANIKVLVMDEIDGLDMSAGDEGNTVDLAINRTKAAGHGRKLIFGSTPVDADTSLILAQYEQSDKRVFKCPCPHCGHKAEITWKNIRWDDDPSAAYWACGECGGVVEDEDKRQLIDAGEWVATAPEVKGHAGFKLTALTSLLPSLTWGHLAQEWLAAQGDTDKLKAFVTTSLAEPWKEIVDTLDDAAIAERAESVPALPPEFYWITCGVDVQRNRLELVTVAHGLPRNEGDKEGPMLVLDQQVFFAATGDVNSDDSCWQALTEYVRHSEWPTAHRNPLKIDAIGIDSGDGETTERVYSYARATKRVWALKGTSARGKGLTTLSKQRGIGSLVLVDTHAAKEKIYGRLNNPKDEMIRFSDTLPPGFYEQLCGEERRVVTRGGRARVEWFQPSHVNVEALDGVVYAMATRHLVSTPATKRQDELTRPENTPSRSKMPPPNAWLSRGEVPAHLR